MSIFDKIGRAAGNVFGGLYHAVTGTPTASEKRKQQQAIQSQIDFYKKQTSIADSEMARARDQQLVEKRRIDEKQIRSLRRNYRAAGFLDAAGSSLTDKLGS